MLNHARAWLLRGAIALNMLSPAAALDNPLTRGPLADFINVFREQAIPRQVVIWRHPEFKKGTIVVSTKERRLYYVLGESQAVEYGVGVGREGFTWSGIKSVTRKREWPDWRPPPQMLKRRPDLPKYMAGGIDNPLGAVLGGFAVGVIENLGGASLVGTELKLTLALVIIVAVLTVKPTGLMGRKVYSRV